MEAKDLRKLPWIRVTDWSELNASYYSEKRKKYVVTPKDMKIFIKNICQEISCQLNLSYKSVWREIRLRNKVFFSSSRWFIFWICLDKNSSELKTIEKLFWIPDVSKINKVDRYKELFKQLSPEERMQFLLDTFSITLDVTLEAIKLQAKEINEINKAKEEEDSF